jgi:1-acylglycerone phosphate reductase
MNNKISPAVFLPKKYCLAPNATPTAKFAKHVVGKCLKSSPPRYIDYGTMSNLFRFLWRFPRFITDYIFSKRFGLLVLKKHVKGGQVKTLKKD